MSSEILGAIQQSLIILKIGSLKIVVNEKYFVELMAFHHRISAIPGSPNHVVGIINHEEQAIPVLNLAKILDQNDVDDPVIVILKSDVDIFAILIEKEGFSRQEASGLTRLQSQNKDMLLFENILFDEQSIYFELNAVELSRWANRVRNYQLPDWLDLIKVDPIKKKLIEQVNVAGNLNLEYVGIRMPDYTFIVPVNQVLNIRNVNAREMVKYEGISFVNYNQQWIPSIELEQMEEAQISIIIQSGDNLFEVISNYAYFENVKHIAIEETVMMKLYLETNYYGIREAFVISEGLGFSLNIDTMAENLLSVSSQKIKQIIKSIKEDVPAEIEELDSLLHIWQSNVHLVLLMTDVENINYATPITSIEDILLDHDGEFVAWTKSKENNYFYLKSGNEDNVKYYQIPAECFLRPVTEKEMEAGIISGEQQVRIVKLEDLV